MIIRLPALFLACLLYFPSSGAAVAGKGPVEPPERAQELYQQGFAKLNDQPELADSLISQAWRISFDNQDKKGIADGFYFKGCVFDRKLMVDSAINYLQRSIVLYGVENAWENVPDAYGRIGLLNFKKNKAQQGLEYLMKGIQKAEKYANKPAAIRLAIVLAMHHNDYTSHYHEAIEYLKKAEKSAEELGDKNLLAHIYLQLSISYVQLNQLPRAARAAHRSIDQFREIGSVFNQTRAYLSLAEVYWKEQSTDKILMTLNTIENLLERHPDMLLQAAYDKLYAEALLNQGKYQQALEHANLSLQVFEQTGQEKGVVELSKLKYRVLYALGDIAQADSLYIYTESIQDSVFSERTYAIDSELRQKFQLEAKQHQINVQELEIQHGKSLRYALLGLLVLLGALAISLYKRFSEKNRLNKLNELLLNEVNHRVKNNLQLLSSILHMQNRKLETQEAKDLIRKCVAWMRTFSLIHDTLYLQDNIERINMQTFMSQLCAGNETTSGESVAVQIQASDVELSVDCAMHVGLIMNELIINSYKYAFNKEKRKEELVPAGMDEGSEELSGGHEIHIAMTPLPGNVLKIVYGDSGPGISCALDLSKQKSMGMKLIYGLIRQMQGTVDYDSQRNEFFITVKAKC